MIKLNDCITLTVKNREVVAENERTGDSVTYPIFDETDNAYVHALTLAIYTLYIADKPSYYTGKVICVDNAISGLTTRGKIYDIVDGQITFDDGNTISVQATSFDEFDSKFIGNFIEVV